jgi:hypothetical protein
VKIVNLAFASSTAPISTVRWRQGDAEARHSQPEQDLAGSEQLHDLRGAEQLELR